MVNQIIVFGASITQSPWWTWKDFIEIESGMKSKDLSVKGVGNCYMTHSLLNHKLDDRTLVVGMFTNVDKFDWYVEGSLFRELSEEKHPPIAVSADTGFWCTGSWFPKGKKDYQEKFYSLDYQCVSSIQQILLCKTLCDFYGAKIEIFFDSPIWDYTEQDLNDMAKYQTCLSKRQLLELPLSSRWSNFMEPYEKDLHHDSLIGFCWNNKLAWANRYYKGHPPSSSHWKFYDLVMRPRLSQHIFLTEIELQDKIQQMDKVWQRSC